MAEDLRSFMSTLEAQKAPDFTAPQVHYGYNEDSLLFYFRNEESYARRLNNFVTVFLTFEGDELVGCQVKGLRRKLENDGTCSLLIAKEGKLQLGLFFHLLAYHDPKPESRNQLVELGQRAKGIELDPSEFNSPTLSNS